MALNGYLCSHPELRNKIKDRTGIIHGLEELDAHNVAMEDNCPDDLDVLSSFIIQEALSVTTSTTKGGVNMTEIHVLVARLDGGLVAATEEEDI